MSNRFSGVFDGLAKEQSDVTENRSTPPISPTKSTPPQQKRHNRIPTRNVTKEQLSDDCETCERSRLVDYLENEVEELTDYAKKAEETKDSLRRLEDLRKHLAYLIFAIIGFWLVAVFGLVFLGSLDVYYFQGNCKLSEHSLFLRAAQVVPSTCELVAKGSVLNLSEKIVVALITTTTINILGLAYIVARWLYPDPNGKKKKKSGNAK